MALLSPEQMREFIATNHCRTPEDVPTALKGLFAETLQAMRDAELETHLGYPKHTTGPQPTANRRNGRYPKQVTTEYGEGALQVPRDRDGRVTPAVVPPHQTTMVGIEDQVVALYAHGMSTRDLQAQLAPLYGVDSSPTLVSNITDQLRPRITEWQQRPLAACYAAVCLDAIPYKVREAGRVVTKAAYMVVGMDLEGYQDVRGMWIGAHESAQCWLTVLTELKSRGVQDIRVVAVDNRTGFSEAMATVFPRADVQKCIVHPIRNSLQYAARKDYAALTAARRPIYQAPTEAAGTAALADFADAWGGPVSDGGAARAGELARTGDLFPVSRGVAPHDLHHEPH